jgi:ABC-type multidrug transport system fused ATPase/permease subunit
LLACGFSFLYLLYQASQQFHKPSGYKAIGSDDDGPDTVPESYGLPEEEDGGSIKDDDETEDLTLTKAVSGTNISVIELDRPRGEVAWVCIEIVALLGQLGVNITALPTHAWGNHGIVAAAAQSAVWGYIFCLASMRLLLSSSKRFSFPKLWYHTAFLYGFQWFSTIMLFRSSLIHPRGFRSRNLMIAEFSITSLLFLIALTARKGNRAVKVEYEDDLEPSREPLASVLSIATFSWVDTIVWRGYKKTMELTDVWNLPMKDKAASVLADYRQFKRTSSLAWHLVKYFNRALLIQGMWAMFSNLFTFLPAMLLKGILEYVEDPSSTPRNAAWFYVCLLFVAGAVQAVADGQALWIGRKICIRLRAIIVGEIYAKALRRKAASTTDKVLGGEKKDNQLNGEDPKKLKAKMLSFGRKKKTEMKTAKDGQAKDADAQANTGTIINLMSVDSFKIAEICAYLHFLWASVPVQVTIAVVLLYRVLGYSSIAGIVIMIFVMPLNMIIAKQFAKTQKKIMAATDGRIHSTNEVLSNIRIIKYFAWEERFGILVNDKRRVELKRLRNRYILWACAATVWYGVPILITFSSFFIYTVIEKKELLPSVAFPALSLFQLLRVPLDQLADMIAHVQETKVSIDRVEEFLNEEETEKYRQLHHRSSEESEEPTIGLESATLTWGSREEAENAEFPAFRLINMTFSFHVGKLNIIAGPTGSGKTSLLMALLGEMKLLEGSVYLPGSVSREHLRVNPETGLTESVAYCAQQAWLVNDTIKENITFAVPYDESRYKAVIKACALERDLEILEAGDQTLVGEKGITVSGGQKQRISLARAFYSNSRHVLLDDCLSAVDSHTAKHIFEHGISGPMMMNRTCILVTHNIALTVPSADYVVVLDNGKIVAQGPPDEVTTSGVLGDELLKSRPTSRGNSQIPSRVPSDLEEQTRRYSASNGSTGIANGVNGSANESADLNKKQQDKKPVEANKRTEGKAEGSVKMATIQMYLSAMGTWYYWILAVSIFLVHQVGSVATNVWIREWANSYHTRSISTMDQSSSIPTINFFRKPSIFLPASLSSASLPWNLHHFPSTMLTANMEGDNSDSNLAYYLTVYALIGVAYLVISFIREAVLFWGSLHASWKIHEQLLLSVMRAKFRFFDSTPLGQMINRFSKDLEAVDQEVAPVAIGMFHSLASVIVIVILISVVTPAFLVAAVFITALFCAVGAFYLNSSRDLKRLESVNRSPLFQQFGETLTGVVTIRAYNDERRFVRDNQHRVNTQTRPFIYLWAANRWLAFRVDMSGALVAFFAGAFVLRSVGKVDAGAAGLSLSYAISFTEGVLWLVRLYSSNEQNMNSVERVKEYLDVEQEAKAHIPDTKPPGNWPSRGAVQFINYSTRYREDLDPVLKNVTFNILPSEKVGIVGRTGAGKSSLALALFRGLEAEEGSILVDDIDIGLIGLQDLRENITMVPQDPTLFTGTIRSNLDPFGLFTDEEIFTALRRVQLVGPASISSSSSSGASTPPETSVTVTCPTPPETEPSSSDEAPSLTTPETPTSPLIRVATNTRSENKNPFRNLNSPVAESGTNLSQGQRQLLCLARALLKSPRVLLMDEATASIDYATDAKIQDTLRELKDSTIITIAHRLQTIIDYDKVLVLERGSVVEFGSPDELIRRSEGTFRGMCDMSGDLEGLIEGARKAAEAKRRRERLVDIE